jgi:hypothetical protein
MDIFSPYAVSATIDQRGATHAKPFSARVEDPAKVWAFFQENVFIEPRVFII